MENLQRMEEVATRDVFDNDWVIQEKGAARVPAPWWRGVPDVYGNVDGKCMAKGEETSCTNTTSSTDALGESLNPRGTNYLLAIWCWRLVKPFPIEDAIANCITQYK